jgi:glycosyltransferase involved in cell wall biosynthesis
MQSDSPHLHFISYPLGVPAQYRVRHQVEQAQMAGLHAQAVSIYDVPAVYHLKGCDALYLYRTPLSSRTWPLCALARRKGIPIIFDSDDLVWDPEERRYNYLDDHYSPREVTQLLRVNARTRSLMRMVNAFVFSTPYLAQRAAALFPQPAYVNQNTVSRAMQTQAEALYAARRPPADRCVIGYFCGTPRVHDEDMATVADALCAVLAQQPHVSLRFYGEVRLPERLAAPQYARRVERRPAVAWSDLLYHVAQVDIAIAPLIDNPQRRAKSAVKYIEAALVGVPTVAARLEPYQEDIAHGATGFLASSTNEWVTCLGQLARSPDLRRALGDAARADVLARHTTEARASNFAAIITDVLTRAKRG